MAHIQLVKQTSSGLLLPATPESCDFLHQIKIGEWIHADFKRVRNYAFHKRFFKLLQLGFDYWTPVGGAITPRERKLVSGFVDYLCESVGREHTPALSEAAEQYLNTVATRRTRVARMRYKIDGLRNGIDVTTTPEGFKFVYEQFVKAVREKTELASLYGLVQASTFDNEKNLPADYIPSLLESYPPELIKAYLRGQFTNLTSGTVYHQFDRKLNNCEEVEQPGEPIYIGMDFNVGKMAGIVHVLRLGLPCAVTEIINAYDTPDMIRIIKERFWLYDGNDYRKVREIYIYPDASGDSRKSSNASTTDIAQLKQAGFNVVVNSSNPPVKDRVNSMNAMFCNANGERRYKVNVKRCPLYAESLEQQVWDEKGEPDKKSGNDHPNDAGGYFIVKQFPIVKPTGRVTSLRI
ncbi:TPA: DUF1367 family protein [Escherichia coli]|nr:DUF1367 family protein [Escherichia coli]